MNTTTVVCELFEIWAKVKQEDRQGEQVLMFPLKTDSGLDVQQVLYQSYVKLKDFNEENIRQTLLRLGPFKEAVE